MRPPNYPDHRLHAENFPEANVTFAEGQEEYYNLHGFRDKNDQTGISVFKWKMTWKQRIYVLFTGTIWQASMTFDSSLQPQALATQKEEFIKTIK